MFLVFTIVRKWRNIKMQYPLFILLIQKALGRKNSWDALSPSRPFRSGGLWLDFKRNLSRKLLCSRALLCPEVATRNNETYSNRAFVKCSSWSLSSITLAVCKVGGSSKLFFPTARFLSSTFCDFTRPLARTVELLGESWHFTYLFEVESFLQPWNWGGGLRKNESWICFARSF